MEKEITPIKDLINYIPAGSILLILVSFVGNYFYYSIFNINIVNFFETSDYIDLFFREVSELWINFFYILIAITVLVLIYRYRIIVKGWFSNKKKKLDSKNSGSNDGGFFTAKRPNSISTGLFFLFIIQAINIAFEIHLFNGFLFIVVGSVVLISLILYFWIDEIKRKLLKSEEKAEPLNTRLKHQNRIDVEDNRIVISNLKKALSFTAFFGIVLVLVIKNIDYKTYQILAKRQPEFNYTIVFEADTIRTDTTLVLLGSSKRYFFLFDLESNKSIVYQSSDIRRLSVNENPDYISFAKNINTGVKAGIRAAYYLQNMDADKKKKNREKRKKEFIAD